LIVGVGVLGGTEQGSEAFRALLSPERTQQPITTVADEETDELREERRRLAAELEALREEAASERQRMARLLEVQRERDLALAREDAKARAQRDWERLRGEEDAARLQRENEERLKRKDDDARARWIAADHEARTRAEEERRKAYERERLAAEAPVILIPEVVPGVTPPRYWTAERERERETGTARNRGGAIRP
jgi:hypothetical protein